MIRQTSFRSCTERVYVECIFEDIFELLVTLRLTNLVEFRITNFSPFSLSSRSSCIFLAAIGKRKFEGLGQQGDPKRRFGIGNGGSWGSQPLPQQPLNGAEQWYTDTYPAWS